MPSYFLSSLLKCYSWRSWLIGVYLKRRLPDMVRCSKTGLRLGYRLRVGCLAATCETLFFVCGGWYFHQCFKFCAIYPLPPKICSSHLEWGISMIKQIWVRCEVDRICSVSCSRWFWIYQYSSILPLGIITVISGRIWGSQRLLSQCQMGCLSQLQAAVPLGSVLGSTPVFPRPSSLEALLKSTLCRRPDVDTHHQDVLQKPLSLQHVIDCDLLHSILF